MEEGLAGDVAQEARPFSTHVWHLVPLGAFAAEWRSCGAALAGHAALRMALLEPKLVGDQFKLMSRSDGAKTWFLAAVPVYKEEMELKLSQGAEKLEELLTAAGVSELVDPKRINVAFKH